MWTQGWEPGLDYVTTTTPRPQLYVEALTNNVTVFGEETFREVINVKWGYKGTSLIQ